MSSKTKSAAESEPPRHSLAEDVHALVMASSFAAFGLVLLKAAGLVTGGVAGLALMVSYLTGWPVGLLLVAINLPFFLLAQRRMGAAFTLKSLATMAALAGFSVVMPLWITLDGVHPAFAAVFGGSLVGMGILALARHRASVGGVGILVLYLHEKRGWNAGAMQMGFDCAVIACAFFIVDPAHLAYSVLSALALSLVMILNHRPGRYTGY